MSWLTVEFVVQYSIMAAVESCAPYKYGQKIIGTTLGLRFDIRKLHPDSEHLHSMVNYPSLSK